MENRTELEKQQAKIIEQQKKKITNLQIFNHTFLRSFYDLGDRTNAIFYAIKDENSKEKEPNPVLNVLADLGAHYTELSLSEGISEEKAFNKII